MLVKNHTLALYSKKVRIITLKKLKMTSQLFVKTLTLRLRDFKCLIQIGGCL